jgi:hypothetical protein
MPHNPQNAKANKGFTPKTQTKASGPMSHPSPLPPISSSASSQMRALVQEDQQELEILKDQMELYGYQRSVAVVEFFQSVINASNVSIENGVQKIGRGMKSDFLQETGMFFQGFKSLKNQDLRLALPPQEETLEAKVIQ